MENDTDVAHSSATLELLDVLGIPWRFRASREPISDPHNRRTRSLFEESTQVALQSGGR